MTLFNIMSVHGFVPDSFGVGTIVPIIKNRLSDVTDSSNYRGITLSPLISKLFEHCILDKYNSYMASSDLQFGFKKNLGCNHAVFALRQCVEYFVTCGSSVYMAALDATKAFDRINHIKLFHRLYVKERATRVQSTLSGRNRPLVLFLVTCGGLWCF